MRHPKCDACGHPLPIKPDPALPNEAGRRPAAATDETRILLTCVFVLALTVMVEAAVLWRMILR